MDKFGPGKSNEKTQKAVGYISGKNMEVWGNFTNWHIIFKIYFLDQIIFLKDLASSARNPQYTGRSAMKKFGRAIVSRYNSYRLKERSKLYLHNTSPFNTKIALSEV